MNLSILYMVNQYARRYRVLLILHKTFRVNNSLLTANAFYRVAAQIVNAPLKGNIKRQ